jgi:hypothetical protein
MCWLDERTEKDSGIVVSETFAGAIRETLSDEVLQRAIAGGCVCSISSHPKNISDGKFNNLTLVPDLSLIAYSTQYSLVVW